MLIGTRTDDYYDPEKLTFHQYRLREIELSNFGKYSPRNYTVVERMLYIAEVVGSNPT
jgi:hypothetical protein